MASPKEIDLVCDIQRICIQVNMQGKYHAFLQYSGHVQLVNVYMYKAPYLQNQAMLKGWTTSEHNVYLSTGYEVGFGEEIEDVIAYKVDQLEKLKADLAKFLDVDADGVPV